MRTKVDGSAMIRLQHKPDYVEMGNFYRDRGRLAAAERAYLLALKINPQNDLAYIELGGCYLCGRRYSKAEKAFLKAIELNPRNQCGYAYSMLGTCYRLQGRFSEAVQVLTKTLEFSFYRKRIVCVELGNCYLRQGKYTEAEQLFSKAIETDPDEYSYVGGLAGVYGEMGERNRCEEYWNKAMRSREKRYNPITTKNYLKLKQVLDKRKIRLVCV